MKLKNPIEIRQRLAENGLLTYEEIAKGVGMSNRTVGRLFTGKKIRYGTIKKLSNFLKAQASDIAEMTPA